MRRGGESETVVAQMHKQNELLQNKHGRYDRLALPDPPANSIPLNRSPAD
jgi:hypothetical protein